ncbi:AAA family ATPase [Pseudomonas sp. LPB0260]|uniref:AAA family ATPase n=1 Tax=Pseudomonas sp. LPB0260 TaxID=2614442 RepID=UPI0015C2B630|nr:AAA family ATPase [Pseudomonas sp. LPB0260]QLC73690.1 AAA family ATPase [Pseudomonas sp. LPB0260]QLC76464.1 AAA family ATPase [Pseudomonas sp. LPB0260]
MIIRKPTIKINRLLAAKSGNLVYDERFHTGLNILSGCNGGGKTSVIQLLVYGLGYEVQNWKEEAGSCDEVFVECSLNGQSVTLNRALQTQRASMQLYYGNLDAGLKAGRGEWFSYPYNTGTKESFSQKLFEILGIPEVKLDASENLTMHQLLRLIYSNQANPPSSIFNIEAFDSAFKREAIGKYLCGLYDNDLYNEKIELSTSEKSLDKIITEIRAITNILGKTEISSELFTTDQLRNSYLDEIKSIKAEIMAKQEENRATYKEEKQATNQSANDITKIKESLYDTEVTQRDLEFEVEDIRLFLSELNQKLQEINDSMDAGNALSSIAFKVCPCCFSELPESTEGACSLCGSSDYLERRNTNMLRMKNEISIQLKESHKIYERKSQTLDDIGKKKKELETELRKSITKTVATVAVQNSQREKELFALYTKTGELEQKIADLERTEELRNAINALSTRRQEIQDKVSALKNSIELKESLARIRPGEVHKIISECVVSFLKSDSGSEKEFQEASEIEYDFAASRVSVNGKTYFSESSISYLNNAFHLALLKLSLAKDYARFPRLLILDGIENFGLEDQRSQNFQMSIKNYFAEEQAEHQIIIATKTIHPDLNNPEVRVGDHFTKEAKSLKM